MFSSHVSSLTHSTTENASCASNSESFKVLVLCGPCSACRKRPLHLHPLSTLQSAVLLLLLLCEQIFRCER
ncbi:hypothetical protein K503DRAFT_208801 [Rhizopogon vinicolor AM-OR11-026]|uniref:Uncharacterized protein n=1 Tax=Rhizopogon vinicolor AM-OR11-026 TaxID=1314800 RepID=A0A1B7MYX6_9AGAM|nr:hypothetical protein K503DRAFT_208801 [Rhizopogon vinicolor AM-OR11-026]